MCVWKRPCFESNSYTRRLITTAPMQRPRALPKFRTFTVNFASNRTKNYSQLKLVKWSSANWPASEAQLPRLSRLHCIYMSSVHWRLDDILIEYKRLCSNSIYGAIEIRIILLLLSDEMFMLSTDLLFNLQIPFFVFVRVFVHLLSRGIYK